MNYATTLEFIGAFENRETVELTNMENPSATTVNTDRLIQAIGDASAEIDTYLWRYKLPLVSSSDPLAAAVVNWLRPCALDIARYRLYQNSVSEDIRNKYLDWIKRLEMCSKGTLKLPDVALVTDVAIVGNQSIRINRGERTYREAFRGF